MALGNENELNGKPKWLRPIFHDDTKADGPAKFSRLAILFRAAKFREEPVKSAVYTAWIV